MNSESPISTPSVKSPWLALLLTLLFPGAGHLYLGYRWPALIYAVMGAGIWIAYWTTHSFLGRLGVLFIMPFVFLPACRDTWSAAKGRHKPVTGNESVIYVLWMLACVGPFAMPLLWMNKKISVFWKIFLSICVLSIVALFFGVLSIFGKSYDSLGLGT